MRDLLNYLNDHIILYFFSISLLLLLIFASRISKKDKKLLIYIIVSVLALAAFEYIETIFNDGKINYENFPRYLFSTLSYISRPTIIVLFFYLRIGYKDKRLILLWIPSILNSIIYILALFAYKNPAMQFVYWFSPDNIFDRTWLGYTVHIVSGLYLIGLIVSSIVETVVHKSKMQINIIILLTSGIAVFAQVLPMVLKLKNTYTSEVFILGATLYFLYLSYENAYQEARLHEREIQEKTTALMLSQIQPHFVYNTLATIQVLCDINPELAAKTIEDFSKYLRINTDALSKKTPVNIQEEIKHVEAYSKIEMLRFDNVKVLFDIEDTLFDVPVLTIQPLVENAIKYGVRAKAEGIVTVTTKKIGQSHVLIIKDNGVGFDVNMKKNDGRVHVGIENVKTRIENMVGGTFKLESEIGQGTTITIIIPEVKNESNLPR